MIPAHSEHCRRRRAEALLDPLPAGRASGFSEVIDDVVGRGLAEVVAQTERPYIASEGSTCRQIIMRVS